VKRGVFVVAVRRVRMVRGLFVLAGFVVLAASL
jgi:hypothetical protein